MVVRRLVGDALLPQLPALAGLRIEVFRAYPYLYEGSLAYEQDYLRGYAETEGSVIVGAFDGDTLVGAATGVPLRAEPDSITACFHEHGDDPERWFYFGESVLRSRYRGRGIGVAFFREREAHARALGYAATCFCGVVRPGDHPLRPADWRPLDAFWRHRGYAPLPGHIGSFEWRDVGASIATAKPMQFWGRQLP
ncbi:MAG: GNAT family N-acetyltransferase [Deltaproteobacteria bacterium]|nr:GNAT family N-acetyltransferase [Deltaproteobacteria bacterium]